MDDLLSGCDSVSEGIKIYNELTELLDRGGFKLQKWSSNSPTVLEKLQLKQDSIVENNIDFNSNEVFKILGLQWNRKTDEFEYRVNLPPSDQPITKRKIISDIARLFDPLGWLAPVIVKAKVFIQRTWLSGVDWDEELPSELLRDWIAYRAALVELTNFRLPRWIQLKHNNKTVQLHGFSDASSEAYAAVVYLRIEDSAGQIHVNLFASKSRVAPIKQISIPRLDLCGAVLLAKLLDEVATTLKIPKENLYAWSDSLVVLAWLSSHPSKWKTFVGNRVADILTILDSTQWSYVPSEENPADCASRGIQPDDCTKLELWKKGPSWLKEKILNYDRSKIKETNLEIKTSKVKSNTATYVEEDDILSRFSSLRRLIRVVAYCKRIFKLRNTKKFIATKYLIKEEINEALLNCIRLCQIKHFEEEIKYLKEKRQIKRNSRLTSLNPVLDGDGILRVGGRLQSADIDHDMMHPILIPNKSHFTNLILEKHPGLDNFTRVVSLRCKDKIIKRPVSKIIILPIAT
ncbi:uncharacterized protein LOC123659122 [Melitaea cinxia]|uniref:uncharacterized protein LOC123659122 n=1 Tax=Melitaea cinxia TaxID=113334 RepID=UPI001E26EFB2|nr:uncharacterized protein LOC123659122 [Melitaea cinxia]